MFKKLFLLSVCLSMAVIVHAKPKKLPGTDIDISPGGPYAVNWSGYVAGTDKKFSGNTVTSVSGDWTVPVATTEGYASTFIGIGGFLCNTSAIQVGSVSQLVDGKENYYGWFQLPNRTVEIPLNVKPGDTISAKITGHNDRFGIVFVVNSGEPFSKIVSAKNVNMQTAEWVLAAPTKNMLPLPLTNFRTESFSNCMATINEETGPINRLFSMPLTLENETGEAIPGPLSPNGKKFGISFTK